ncbi:MAG: hypothetical protein JXP34_25765 [Planctomycetes bacterium]|nr:hypothetical protein [Planctomycetota bacterium]
MQTRSLIGFLMPFAALLLDAPAGASNALDRYYAHAAVEDAFGAIASWHPGQHGPCDERARIAVELYKRYPWVGTDRAVMAAPHIIYNTHWSIADDGTIAIPQTTDWMCGDLSQRALSIIQGLTAYYAYGGDPLVFTYLPLACDYILDHCLTSPDHPWPRFPVATPIRGKAYGPADPRVPNQLDLCAILGTEFLRAYRLTGEARYRDAAFHWGDVIAGKRIRDPGLPPWNRYVSPQYMAWSDELTAGTVLIADFLDACIRAGHRGAEGAIVASRDAARAYIRESLLARWAENEVWGRHYWDWESPVYCGIVPWCCEYFLAHPDAFPDWRIDVRNVLALAFNRNCVSPESEGDVYSGAWAFPETSSCCETSLSYNQYTYAPVFLQYGLAAGDEWAREIGRRMIIQAAYDSRENGVVLDGLRGKVVAAGEWLNLAHPWPLCQALKAMGWAPEILAPSRENHIVRMASVATSVRYEKGAVRYATFDALPEAIDVLRLSFSPRSVEADGAALERRADLEGNGYTLKPLPGGDAIVAIRHDGSTSIAIEGDDPQEVAERPAAGTPDGFAFTGNQVRVVGAVGPDGGLADVFLDGERQLAPIDFWCPSRREGQIVYARSGLAQGRHRIRIVPRDAGNPLSEGNRVGVDAIQFSAAMGPCDLGAGEGPAGAQRMIFGYLGRRDYVDSRGNAWRPGLEFVARTGKGTDSVARALWTERRTMTIHGTPDPEIYRYGLHGAAFRVNITVAPGTYGVRLHFADTLTGARQDVSINGKRVLRDFAVAEAAGGIFRAVARGFGGISPAHGIIEIGFEGAGGREASVQAIEVEPAEPATGGGEG